MMRAMFTCFLVLLFSLSSPAVERNADFWHFPLAAKTITRSLEDIPSLRGASEKEIRNLIPKNWIEKPLKKGNGMKFINPEKPGEAIFIERGWPGAPDPLHAGPYLKISRDGQITRIPMQGNSTL